ncbi:AfsR/SARP family transcriptional regulator [Nonomuraea muscovyensis]
MRFGLLGAFEVTRDGVPVAVPAVKQRIALATLLLRANQHVSFDQLAERMWDGREAPDDARAAVQTHIARLRRTLLDRGARPRLIHTREEGYSIELATDDLDVTAFLDLVGRAERAGRAGDVTAEVSLLRRALALWRGPALVDVPSDALHRDHVPALDERRARALERRFDLGLRAGLHDELVVELKDATAAHPLRERLWAQLMLALHRSGRQAEALQSYRAVSRLLREELGVDPGEELLRLYREILAGAPGPSPSPSPSLSPEGPTSPSAAATPADPTRPDTAASPAGPARPDTAAPPGPGPRPRQLPAGIAPFTGRLAQLAALDELLSEAGGGAPRPVVIDGTGGVGKTALAVHWSRLVQNRFPDGQLYLDLRGFGPGAPLDPAAALETLLRALDVPAERIPAEPDARSALWRSELAGRRLLILLDNARDEASVRPLLPGGRSLVLITSRNQLRGLAAREGAHRVTVGVFSPEETHALLSSVLDADRLRADPRAEAELGELCARLPLALRIAAANLGADPHLSLADYVTELREGNRLCALEAGDDQAAAMRATFELSYTALPERGRRLFRLLGLVPGGSFTPGATAALAGCPTAEARQELTRLAASHLIHADGPGRYCFHDLLRLYAADRAAADEEPVELRRARRRLQDWYLRSATAAARLLHPHWVRLPPAPPEPGVTPVAFGGEESAAAWLDAEHANLVAMIRDVRAHGPGEPAWRLTDALRGHFWMSRRMDDWLGCAAVALSAARAEGDPAAQAVIQLSLANAHMHQDRLEQATALYTRALSLTEEARWLDCRASALGGLALARLRLGYPRQAVEPLEEALALSRRTGNARGQEAYLNNLAHTHRQLGRLEQALDHLRPILDAATDNPVIACNVGEVCHSLGRLGEAAGHLTRGVSLSRQSGDRAMEAECLIVLAAVHHDLGHDAEALLLGGEALAMSRDLGDRILQAGALNVLGAVHHGHGRHREALEVHQQALQATKQGGNRYPEVVSLIGLAGAARALGRLEDAAAHAERARATASDRSFRMLEGLALTAVAQTWLARGAASEAAAQARLAVAAHRESGHRLGEARALRVLCDALCEEEGVAAAVPYQRTALLLFSEIGSREAGSPIPATASGGHPAGQVCDLESLCGE